MNIKQAGNIVLVHTLCFSDVVLEINIYRTGIINLASSIF
jgi:hypothetical protein